MMFVYQHLYGGFAPSRARKRSKRFWRERPSYSARELSLEFTRHRTSNTANVDFSKRFRPFVNWLSCSTFRLPNLVLFAVSVSLPVKCLYVDLKLLV